LCHLSSKEIAENKKYRNITGDASDKEKLFKWAENMPACIGNPLYHWTHLDLHSYFGIKTLLLLQTVEEIWQKCNDMLKKMSLVQKTLSNVQT